MKLRKVDSEKQKNETGITGKVANEVALADMWATVWADKCKQIYTKATVVLADDTRIMAVINNLMEKPKKIEAQMRKKVFIKMGIVAIVVIVIGIIITVNSIGVGVEVPVAAAIPSESVFIRGDLEGYFKVLDPGIAINYINTDNKLNMLMTVEMEKAIMQIEKQLADSIKTQGWNMADCHYEMSEYSSSYRY
jgi:hypothetical protein